MVILPPIPDTNGTDGKGTGYPYTLAKRDKSGKRWIAVAKAECGGGGCNALASEYFAANGFPVSDGTRLFDSHDWHKIQVRQHLKAVGIKSR